MKNMQLNIQKRENPTFGNLVRTFMLGVVICGLGMFGGVSYVNAQEGFEAPDVSKPSPGGLPTQTPDGDPINLRTEGGLISFIVSLANIFLGLLGLILVLMLLYGGFKYMTAGESQDQAKNARTTLYNAVIGIVLISLIYVTANFVLAAAFG